MLRLFIVLLGFGISALTPDQPFWTAYGNQVNKELAKWSGSFEKVDYLRTLDEREFYRINNRAGEPPGTLVLTSAQGRFERFDLLVALDAAGKIGLVRILKYRSEYGSEITSKGWLSQFYKTPDSTYAMHKNIDAASGATYSSMGLIEEINAILSILKSGKDE